MGGDKGALGFQYQGETMVPISLGECAVDGNGLAAFLKR
jgi:hypothetical protein